MVVRHLAAGYDCPRLGGRALVELSSLLGFPGSSLEAGEGAVSQVSILMPTYEREDLIGDSIRSALDQTFTDFVLIVGDNSESDRTEELVRSFDDPRIRYHRNRPGLGPMGNWVDLVERAETPFIATLHDDDTWRADFLEKTVAPMVDDPEIAMVYTDFWIVDKDGNRRPELTESESSRTGRTAAPTGRVEYSRDQGVKLVAVDNAPQPAYAATVRTSVAQAVVYPTDIEPLYDVWLTYALIMENHPLYYINDRLTNYRVHDASETAVSPHFASAEDAFFTRAIADNKDLPDTVRDVKGYWAWLRWARATKLMNDPAGRSRSQAEFAIAAPDLKTSRRLIAQLVSKVTPAWHVLRLALAAKSRR
jgi:glycosyltransferase involved in cell wall biosynthesis